MMLLTHEPLSEPHLRLRFASLKVMSLRSRSEPRGEAETNRHRENQDGDSTTLTLNVLLLGDRQSGRSSVGNGLIGGAVFHTGPPPRGPSASSRPQLVSRTFPRYFRRNGAESHLCVRVIDTPPGKPRPQELRALCPGGVHVLVMVVRADLVDDEAALERHGESLFGADWLKHSLLVLTHADRLQEAGLRPAFFLTQAPDWLRALSDRAGGGALFVDSGCDWPSLTGKPIRDRVLSLSARNHHQALPLVQELLK